jgi:NAD(P)H-flavin reductase
VHVVHVISGDEPDWQGERGFITAELIGRYAPEDASFFICGPQGMYGPMAKALAELNIPSGASALSVWPGEGYQLYPGFPWRRRTRPISLPWCAASMRT